MLFPYGGGDHAICRLYSDIENVGDGHTTCNESFPIPYRYEERGRIQLVPIDEVIGPKERIFFLKIDVEGYELKVMKTAKWLLKKGKIAFLVSEVSRQMMGEGEVEEYLELLWDSGFEVHFESFNGIIISTLAQVHKLIQVGEKNIYCVHKTWRVAADENHDDTVAARRQLQGYLSLNQTESDVDYIVNKTQMRIN